MPDQNQQKIHVDLNSMDLMECPKCKGTLWLNVYHIKKIPALISKTGNQEIAMIPANLICIKCGTPFTETEFFKEKNKEEEEPRIISP